MPKLPLALLTTTLLAASFPTLASEQIDHDRPQLIALDGLQLALLDDDDDDRGSRRGDDDWDDDGDDDDDRPRGRYSRDGHDEDDDDDHDD